MTRIDGDSNLPTLRPCPTEGCEGGNIEVQWRYYTYHTQRTRSPRKRVLSE